ncbi:MAG TPA: VOC family protein [Terriglobales bacterium]|nr:VOC family protein [Terriglobales bacterium]
MIEGIGGVFLFSNDTKRLVTWYRDCLGILPEGQDSECDSIYKSFEYRDIENPEIKRTIVWAIIPTKQDIKDTPRTGRINYLVKNLGEVLSHLKSKGVAIEKTAEDPYGNFAWVRDPDGNQIELWEPSESG